MEPQIIHCPVCWSAQKTVDKIYEMEVIATGKKYAVVHFECKKCGAKYAEYVTRDRQPDKL